jgi:hypothetical protein
MSSTSFGWVLISGSKCAKNGRKGQNTQATHPLLVWLAWHLHIHGCIFVTGAMWHIHNVQTEDWKLIWLNDTKGIDMDQGSHNSTSTPVNVGDPPPWNIPSIEVQHRWNRALKGARDRLPGHLLATRPLPMCFGPSSHSIDIRNKWGASTKRAVPGGATP